MSAFTPLEKALTAPWSDPPASASWKSIRAGMARLARATALSMAPKARRLERRRIEPSERLGGVAERR